MTAVTPPVPDPDVSGEQAEAESETSIVKKLLKVMSPRFVLSQADGYPVVIKQFLQFCLILVYPAFVFAPLFALAVYYTILLPGYYALLAVSWVLFWPLRMSQRKTNPEEYETYRANYWKRNW
jgi:hypothetical protein